MDRDTVIALAREAGVQPIQEFALMGAWVTNTDAIQRFAALVAAHEREECAKLAITISEQGLPEEMPEGDELLRACEQIAGGVLIADAIRSRT